MPHEKRYKFTKEGYIIKIEDLLNCELPLKWWRIRIGRAAALYDLIKSGRIKKFWALARKYNLPKPVKE